MHLRDRVRHGSALVFAGFLLGAAPLVTIGGTLSVGAGASGPILTASTTSLNFGETTLGTYVGPSYVVLTNTSNADDQITGFEFSGDNDFVFDSVQGQCPVVHAKSMCVLTLDFDPGALGKRALTLTVFDTANSGVTISLSGIGGIGYYQVDSSGKVGFAGDAAFYGDLTNAAINKPIVAITPTADDGGYWLVASDGGIFGFGDALFRGSTGGMPLNKPIVGMATTPRDHGGYWLVASDGGIFAYGDAPFYGSAGGIHLNKPIVGMAATTHGTGYWLVASDGGIFAYGAAQFYGSTGGMHLNQPIVAMAQTPDSGGYWLVAADGGVFAYGDAQFYGSTGGIHLNQPIVAMAAMPDAGGYWFTAADGGLFDYGDAPFLGSGTGLGHGPVVGMATDGAPTAQADLHQPAIRYVPAGSSPTGPSPEEPHFAR